MTAAVRIAHSNPEKPVPKEILAEAVVRMGESVSILNRNGMNARAIIVLLQDMTGLPKRDIKTMLDAMPQLHRMYCRG